MNNRKLAILQVGIFIVGLACILRLVYLQIIQREFLTEKAESQFTKLINVSAYRGKIYDRHGEPLALSREVWDAYLVPNGIKNKPEFIRQVHAALPRYDRNRLVEKVNSTASFTWMDRQIPRDDYLRLSKLNLIGLNFVKGETRVYPNTELASHVLGYVGIDNQGLSGIEYQFDSYLKGKSGKIVLEGDPSGRQTVSGKIKRSVAAENGGDIYLTIDNYVQYMAERALKKGVQSAQADFGQIVVMDPRTGEILAMATYPDFDPNNHDNARYTTKRNRIVGDFFEPGSIFKIVTMAAALEEKIVQPNDIMYIPATMDFHGRLIREAHGRDAGESDRRTVSDILERSLNVGTTMLAIRLGEKRLFHYMELFGFGQKTGIELPAESRGLLRPVKNWSAVDVAMHSFGQGIAVTPIQITAAYSTVANRGVCVPPRIVNRFIADDGNYQKSLKIEPLPRAVSEETAEKLTEIMIQTVERGTGVPARIKGYRVAGKTGTAQKAGAFGAGYLSGLYVASFGGFFPANNPRFVIMVIVDSPKTVIYGSAVAAPIFRETALALIDHYDLKPDLEFMKSQNERDRRAAH